MAEIKASEISSIIKDQITRYEKELKVNKKYAKN